MRRRGLAAAIAGVGLSEMLHIPSGFAEGLEVVTFGSINATSDAGVFLADELGFLKQEGISLKVRVIQDAPSIIAATATSQLDVGGVSVTPGLFAAVQQNINLRIVGDKQSFSPGFGSTRLVAAKSIAGKTDAETVAALKGKPISVNSKGAITFYFMVKMLEKYGLSLSDVQLNMLTYPNIAVAMETGRVFAGTLIEPFLTECLQTGTVQLLGGDLLEFVPGGSMSVTPLVYSEKFRANRNLAEAFMRAYIRGVRAYNDAFVKGINKDRVIAIIAQRTGVQPSLIAHSYLPGLDPNQQLNLKAYDAVMAFYVQQGLISQPVDISKAVDMSFVDAALKKLGTYS